MAEGGPAAPDTTMPAASPSEAKRGGLFSRRPARVRPHPYADEASTPREASLNDRRVAIFWVLLATGLAVLGLWLATFLSPAVTHGGIDAAPPADRAWSTYQACRAQGSALDCGQWLWNLWTEVILFGGLALLGFGYVARNWARKLTMAGWLMFGFYWALLAQDLLVLEAQDYVNFFFALTGTYFFTYLAYHQWLNEVRGVENEPVRFLNIATFIAATSYFLIDKIQPIRNWLIYTVSDHTATVLGWFGQKQSTGLVYVPTLNPTSDEGLTTYFYPSYQCSTTPGHVAPDATVSAWCQDHGLVASTRTWPYPHDLFSQILHFDPHGDHTIKPVTIILACTALQSMMLFVGLYMATRSSLKRRLVASAMVAVAVYLLNLLRNTGIIWLYGKNVMSFWVIHDAIGKGGSLVAMILIAFLTFRWFPEFLKELIGVLDLPHRDGPLERALRIGRRRPKPASAVDPAPVSSSDDKGVPP